MRKLPFFILVIFILTGCASKYAVQFDSYPQGAALVCDGKNWGYTPTTLYLPQDNVDKKASLNLYGCTANWASGAQKHYGRVLLRKYPDGVRNTVKRPNVPGLQMDMNFALKVQQMKNQQAAARAKAWDDLNQSLKDTAESIRKNTPTSTYTNYYSTFTGVACNSTSY